MEMTISYCGIERAVYPDWLGWVILDLLDERTDESEAHRDEIKIQLEYEVKVFYYYKKAA